MTEMLRNELKQCADKMNEYQLRVVLGFIKRLFHLDD